MFPWIQLLFTSVALLAELAKTPMPLLLKVERLILTELPLSKRMPSLRLPTMTPVTVMVSVCVSE